MNRHVGASFTLSVFVVGLFAVILYQPDHPPPSRSSSLIPNTETPIDPVADDPPPVSSTVAAREPLAEGNRDHAAGQQAPSKRRSTSVRPVKGRPRRSIGLVPTLASKSSEPTDPVKKATVVASSVEVEPFPGRRRFPSSSFTQVDEGESLTDVALRVYGTRDATATLWLANRDIIDRRDLPLNKGMLLRTP
jgi:hypothetical protein